MEKDNYLDSLNPSQRAAVEYCDGPQLVIAGAGSGKTRVLTMKIAYLLQHGYNAEEIIALTFTKKAALEMKARIQSLVGPGPARRLWMGTFHSLFSRILRRESAALGFKSDFTIYDQQDSRSLVKAIIKELNLDDKVYKPNSIQGQISNAKNNLVTPGMYAANRELMMYDAQARRPRFAEIYQQYWNRCYRAGAMDFDDLLLYTNILFRDHPDLLDYYNDYFKYVLVDEYQDTNRAQHLIVEQLVRKHKRLCVVGDDAQSIYSFRGANIRNILDLRQQIPDTRLFKLEQNYRSTQNIVDAANSLISKNKEQIQKTVFSEKERGSRLQLTGCFSDLEESYKVVKHIMSLHDGGYQYHDCAILYRTNAQSRTLEETLRKNGIDYRIYGGLSFYQRKEVKDVVSYMRLVVNPADEEAFKRTINYPSRGIGDTTVGKLIQASKQLQVSLFDLCADPARYEIPVNKGTEGKLRNFAEMISRFQDLNQKVDAYELTDRIVIESGIKEDLGKDSTIEGQSRRENIEELLSAVQDFVTTCKEEGNERDKLIDFLTEASLSGDVEPTEAEAATDCVPLMTIHQAKGLEFKNVFIVGVEENLLPSDMSMDSISGIEEERRLLYVAITRAEENCFLSYASTRFRNGKSEMCRPSRFLKDIAPRYMQTTSRPDSFSDYGTTGGGSFGGDTFGGSSSSGGSFIRDRHAATYSSGNSSSNVSHSEGIPSESATGKSSEPATGKPSVLDFNRPKKVAIRDTSSLQSQATLRYGSHTITAGTRIIHDRFGKGTVTELSGNGDSARISVNFDTMGNKTLLLKFAKFRIEET